MIYLFTWTRIADRNAYINKNTAIFFKGKKHLVNILHFVIY